MRTLFLDSPTKMMNNTLVGETADIQILMVVTSEVGEDEVEQRTIDRPKNTVYKQPLNSLSRMEMITCLTFMILMKMSIGRM